jgi:hypothetical protein
MIKNTTEMRAFLLDQMALVADGQQAPDNAKAICNYAQQLYNVSNLELKYSEKKFKDPTFSMTPLSFEK